VLPVGGHRSQPDIAMAGKNTIIVHGHGPVGGVADQVAFRGMLMKVRNRVAALTAIVSHPVV